jgi:hypothetical protein
VVTDQIVIERLDSLIEQGELILANPKVVGGTGGMIARATYPVQRLPDVELYARWHSQSIALLSDLLGPNHTYTKQFEKAASDQSALASVQYGQGVLRATRMDATGGHLARVRTLMVAEVFDDFLAMADHLMSQNYKDAAAMLIGAVLEDGLRRIATRLDPTATGNMNALNTFCYGKDAYNKLVFRRVQAWTDIRNFADHSDFGQYSIDDVRQMLTGIRGFLTEHLY